jgi:hypothetical protein
MKLMVNTFQGLQTNPNLGKREVSSQGERNTSHQEACTMLHSMSLQKKNSHVTTLNKTSNDNESSDYCCYNIHNDLQDKSTKKKKKNTKQQRLWSK